MNYDIRRVHTNTYPEGNPVWYLREQSKVSHHKYRETDREDYNSGKPDALLGNQQCSCEDTLRSTCLQPGNPCAQGDDASHFWEWSC